MSKKYRWCMYYTKLGKQHTEMSRYHRISLQGMYSRKYPLKGTEEPLERF